MSRCGSAKTFTFRFIVFAISSARKHLHVGQWLSQQSFDLVRRDCFAEKISLSLKASVGLQRCELVGVFYAFGSRRKTKSFCQSQNCAHDGVAFHVLAEALDEVAIDLNAIETEREQLA